MFSPYGPLLNALLGAIACSAETESFGNYPFNLTLLTPRPVPVVR